MRLKIKNKQSIDKILSKENVLLIATIGNIILVFGILILIKLGYPINHYIPELTSDNITELNNNELQDKEDQLKDKYKFELDLENMTQFTNKEILKIRNQFIKKYSNNEYQISRVGCSTNSMGIIFNCDDITIERPIHNISELKLGDIISFNNSQRYVIHRIIDINYTSGNIKTKGDNNHNPDPYNITMDMEISKCVGILYTGNYTLKVVT